MQWVEGWGSWPIKKKRKKNPLMSKADFTFVVSDVMAGSGIMFYWECFKKKKKVLICEWIVGSPFSVWHVPGCSLDKGRLLWMNILKGSIIKASLLSVCVYMWLRAPAHVCRERTPLLELTEKEKQRNVCWQLQLEFQSCCFCCVWLCSVHALARVCAVYATEVIEAKDETTLSSIPQC